jgi:mono/diheme cytochrome c family protein
MKLLSSRLFWGWIAGLATAGALAATTGVLVLATGAFDARAITPHYPPVAWVTHAAMIRAVQVRAPKAQPPPGDARHGAQLFAADCAVCHGAPGVARAAWANGMTPDPPYLLDAARRWTAPQLQLIVRDGVKMTGMPAWGRALSAQDLADVTAFLEALPSLTARDYAALAQARAEPR